MRLVVRVPATTANLGVGFDTLGLALKLYNIFEVNDSETDFIEINGKGVECLYNRENNIFLKALDFFYRLYNLNPPPLSIKISINIPISKGLGSSASAIVAGLMIANNLLDKEFSREELLEYAVKLEGHPDNVTPAFLGGCTISLVSDGKVMVKEVPLPDDLSIIVAIPYFDVPTEPSRKILPNSVPLDVTVKGLARIGMFLVSLITDNLKDLPVILEDELHEPYRARFIPNYNGIKKELLSMGALGVMISGSGPSIVILTEREKVEELVELAGFVFNKNNIMAKILNLDIDYEGAVLEVN
ncbi:MAG TPA: homoserine kinase [bacterium]|nr:homoserine kinase [bacterium]